jgi:hypothetical protein
LTEGEKKVRWGPERLMAATPVIVVEPPIRIRKLESLRG